MDSMFEDAIIVVDLDADAKRGVLQALSEKVAAARKLDARLVMDHLLEREQLGATGVGGGVAMPHGRIQGLDQIAVCFARLKSPIEYESPDGAPVDLVLMLLAPEEAGAVCLKALSKASRVLRSPKLREQLRAAADEKAIRRLLNSGPQAEAA